MAEETKDTTAQSDAEVHTDTTDWKAEARKWEARAKENNKAAEELAELKEAQLSESEKATKRAEKAEAELAEFKAHAEHTHMITEVSEATGIPASLLRGETREDVESFASELKKYMANQPTASVVPGETTKPRISGAASPRDQFAELANTFFK